MVNPMEVGNWEQRNMGTCLMLRLLEKSSDLKFDCPIFSVAYIIMSNKVAGLLLYFTPD